MSHSAAKPRDAQEISSLAEPDIRVRHARTGDAKALSVFAVAIFPLGCPPGTDPMDLAHHISRQLTAERFGEMIENPNAILLVAEAADQICGCVLALRSSSHPQIESVTAAELQKFYVAPAHHGRGVAHELMRQVLASLGRHHSATVWLSVHSENPRAIAFYTKWGFSIVGSHEVLVGADRQKDFVMRRDLPVAPQETA